MMGFAALYPSYIHFMHSVGWVEQRATHQRRIDTGGLFADTARCIGARPYGLYRNGTIMMGFAALYPSYILCIP
jgi:hypothetical protein